MPLPCSKSTNGHPSHSREKRYKKGPPQALPTPLHFVLDHPLPTQLHTHKAPCSSWNKSDRLLLGALVPVSGLRFPQISHDIYIAHCPTVLKTYSYATPWPLYLKAQNPPTRFPAFPVLVLSISHITKHCIICLFAYYCLSSSTRMYVPSWQGSLFVLSVLCPRCLELNIW